MTRNRDVWYHPDAITNILSLSNVKRKYRVTYDSSKENSFLVHTKDKIVIFPESDSGLYAHDMEDRELVMLNTVADNMAKYSKREISGAKKARETYGSMGYPSPEDFRSMVRFNIINNCPVTLQDIEIAEDIWGKDIGALKGKTVREKPIQVKENFIPIP